MHPPPPPAPSPPPWWQGATLMHVWPRSFADGDGDGIGDLLGLRARLPHLADLGVDGIWLCPIFPSPQKDFGYDVADYCAVDPTFGSLADLDALLADLHGRGMRLLLDLVVNHTSSQHPWFVESRSGRRSARRDWYIWSDPAADGGPPNNWVGVFGASAWTLDEPSGQYYLHSFLADQPDLNWRNPAVVEAMADVVRFWLSRGVDGFRVDAVPFMIKDPALRDEPRDPAYEVAPDHPDYRAFLAQRRHHSWWQPGLEAAVGALRDVCDEFDGRVLIGECPAPDPATWARLAGDGTDLLHMILGFGLYEARTLRDLRAQTEAAASALPAEAWPVLAHSSHDTARVVSRLSRDGGPDDALAKAALACLLLPRGTAILYQGEELGLPSTPMDDSALQDPLGLFEARFGRVGCCVEVGGHGRDPVRTPIPWDGGPHAGFTVGTPWLPVAAPARHAAGQREDPSSCLHWARALLRLRRDHPALRTAPAKPLPSPDGVWRFARGPLEVWIHLDGAAVAVDLPPASVACGTHRAQGAQVDGAATLASHEVLVLLR